VVTPRGSGDAAVEGTASGVARAAATGSFGGVLTLGGSGDGAGEGAVSRVAWAALTGSLGGMLPLGCSDEDDLASFLPCVVDGAFSWKAFRAFA